MYPSTVPDMRTFKGGDTNVVSSSYDHRGLKDLGSTSMTSFETERSMGDQSLLVPLSTNSSPYPNRSSQRIGEKRNWGADSEIPNLPPEMSDSIGQRYQQHSGPNPRRSNVIRIDARNYSDNQLDQANGIKRKASCLRTNVSPNAVSQVHNGLGSIVSPPVDQDPRYASLLRSSSARSPVIKDQQVQSGTMQRAQQKHHSTNGSFGNSLITTADTLPRNAVSQDATLPYNHRQRHASNPSDGMQEYKPPTASIAAEQKCPCNILLPNKTTTGSRVTFAAPDKTPGKQPHQQNSLSDFKPSDNGKQASIKKNYKTDDNSESIATNTKKNNNKKSKKHSSLLWIIFVLALLLMATIILLIYFVSQSPKTRDIIPNSKEVQKAVTIAPVVNITTPKGPKITRITDPPAITPKRLCLTESCLKTAAKILSRMDQSVNPCQDFYTYSCGGWLSKNYISPNKIEYSMASKMRERNDRIIYELLIKPTAQANGQRNTNLSQAEEKARKFYHSCIDLEQIEALGSRPLIDLIVSLGGWAARGDDSRWNFNELIYQNQGVLSNSVFFSISVEMDPTNASQHIVMVDQEGSLTLPDRMFYFYDYQLGNSMERVLKGGMRSILRLILPAENVDAVVNDVYRFEQRLAAIQIPVEDIRRRSFDKIPIRGLRNLCPQVEWFRFLQRIFIRKQISLDTEILVIGPQYFFSNLSRLIQNSTRETLENYMMWRTVFSQSSRLSLSFRRAAASLTYDIYGIKDVIPRWKECLGYVKQQFSAAIGLMFVKETFSSAMKKDVFKVVQFIKESFRRNLDSIQWLDRTSKKALSKRLDAISVKIGYDSKYRDMPDLLDTLYSFPVEPFTFFKNYKNSVQGKVNLSAAKLVSPVDNTEWLLPFDYTNAYFSQKRKQMIFPAGFLQQPFYDPAAPSVVNFGAVGSTIGHELVHGFDDIGMRYNNDGSIKDWWSMALFMNYSKRADCVTQTYNRYNSLLGVSTQKENIADMAGVKLSYQAYRAWVQNQPRYSIARRVLPGLSLSNEQIFFVSFAQAWCKKRVASFQPSYTGAHAPERYRVIGSLSQFQSFSDVFSCKPGSPMNPVQKCTVW